MFVVLQLIRSKGKKTLNEIIKALPLGTSFALSDFYIFTAGHNIRVGKTGDKYLPEIGIARQYTDPLEANEITVLSYVAHCFDKDEDWAVYRRVTGTFPHSVAICSNQELPEKNVKIGVRDFPVGLLTVGESSTKISLQSFHTKVSHYEMFIESPALVGKKRKFAVVKNRAPATDERAIQVVGGRVKGSCGAAYFSESGKVVGFHVQSIDDGDEASVSNTYTSDRSHTSFSVGLVLCRLPKFRIWYNANIGAGVGKNQI